MRKKPVNFLNDLKETSFVSTGIENFLWRWFFIVLLCLYACFSYVGEYNRCQFFLYTFLPNLKLFLIWCDSFRFFVFLIILFIIMLVLLVKFLHYWLQYSNDFDEDDDLLADLASYGFIEMDYLSEIGHFKGFYDILFYDYYEEDDDEYLWFDEVLLGDNRIIYTNTEPLPHWSTPFQSFYLNSTDYDEEDDCDEEEDDDEEIVDEFDLFEKDDDFYAELPGHDPERKIYTLECAFPDACLVELSNGRCIRDLRKLSPRAHKLRRRYYSLGHLLPVEYKETHSFPFFTFNKVDDLDEQHIFRSRDGSFYL